MTFPIAWHGRIVRYANTTGYVLHLHRDMPSAVVHCISLNMVTLIMSTEPKPAAMAGDMELVELDVTGLNCPMPLLKAKKALNEMQAQQQLRVVATDPGSVKDFEVFARQSGHLLLESTETNGRYSYLLQKKG